MPWPIRRRSASTLKQPCAICERATRSPGAYGSLEVLSPARALHGSRRIGRFSFASFEGFLAQAHLLADVLTDAFALRFGLHPPQLTQIKALGQAAVACESMCSAETFLCWNSCFQPVDLQTEPAQSPAKMT
jgi:hypothetical protein